MDGVEGHRDIGELLANKMSEVFNSVSFSQNEMDSLLQSIKHDITQCAAPTMNNQCYHSHRVTVAEVSQASKLLKAGKRDGTSDHEFSSDFLVHGPDTLSVHLSLLFDAVLRHGVFPSEFALSTVVPIPKNRKQSLMSSSNYRGIALGSVIAKVFDVVLLNSNKQVLRCSDLQFGFRKKHSTAQCTLVLNETVQYYLNGKSSVHVMFLDASKAFDRVEFTRLFYVLRLKGICPVIARVLLNMYIIQKFRVQWQSETSSWQPATNGVKQGGVISPVLFVNYVDELLKRLKSSGLGCHVGHVYCGCIGYADDVTLLAPSKWALKKMLQICDDYAREFSMLFNPVKSKYMVFSQRRRNTVSSVSWNEQIIEESMSEVHLGNRVGPRSHVVSVNDAVSDFYRRFNYFMSNFPFLEVDVKYRLFKTFCMAMYGSQLWDFSAPQCERFYVAWRKAVRRLCNISPRTHCYLLPLIVGDDPVDVQLHRRFVNFFSQLLNSTNSCVQILSQLALKSGSDVSKSIRFISRKYGFDVDSLTRNHQISHSPYMHKAEK